MTDADIIDDDEELADGPSTGPFAQGLWREARWHLFKTLTVFGTPEEIAREGLVRKLGRRLAAWLWYVEATVRRLILAAAFALGLAPIAPTSRKPQKRTSTGVPTHTPTPRFRVFARHTGRAERLAASDDEPDYSIGPYRHAAFPRDPLLRLGEPATATRPRANSGPRHVYARRAPISRWDPNYRGPATSAWDRELELRARSALTPPPKPRPVMTHSERMQARMITIASDVSHRIAQREAARLIPAPDLARRLQALASLMLDPSRLIARTARRIARATGLANQLTQTSRPVLRLPKSDRNIIFGHDMLASCDACWPPPHDTS